MRKRNAGMPKTNKVTSGKIARRFPMAAVIGLIAGAALIAAASPAAIAADATPVPAASAPGSAPPAPAPETMKVVPAEESPAPEPSGMETPAAAPTKKPAVKHHAAAPPQVEPATARLKLKQDAWIFTGPSKWTKHITRAHAGKYVVVTGTTRYYLQVKLKDGQTGYIAPANVELVTPTDKIFTLTQDAAVLDAPNRWGKKLSEVHRAHAVHVIGVSLNYMKIRMKSGLEGFIPATALQ